MSRRRFLGRAAIGLAGVSVPPNIITGAPISDKIAVGIVGCGARGINVLRCFLHETDARVVAVCDVIEGHLAKARDIVNEHYGNQSCSTFHEFRELVARTDMDAIIVATPDHGHTLMAIAAVRAGKDVYVEKPLGFTVGENQALRAALRKSGRVFQFGTQRRSTANFRRACELVRNGRIGRLQRIKTWCIGSVPGGSTAPAPVPADLDYDLWLGPAPAKPYRKNLCTPDGTRKTWWFNSDYSIGFIASWGVHMMDIAYWGYPEMMKAPFRVEGAGTFPTEGACDTATTWQLDFSFASGVRLDFRGLPTSSLHNADLREVSLWRDKYARWPVQRLDMGERVACILEAPDSRWAVVPRKDSKRSPQPVELSIQGGGTCRILVADLTSGRWEAKRRDGGDRRAVDVSRDSGTAWFEGPAGTWVIERVAED